MTATKSALSYRLNTATPAQLADHLRACSHLFNPPLNETVDIETYAAKMAAHAERFEGWAEGELAGLVCAYLNDLDNRRGFITNVSTLEAHAGRGIASSLVERCLALARARGLREVGLEVHPDSAAAIRLYERAGFRRLEQSPSSVLMQLVLPQ